MKTRKVSTMIRLSGWFALCALAFLLTTLTTQRRAVAEPVGHAEGAEAAAEHGEGQHEEGHHEDGPPPIDPKKLGLQILNFGVLLFILVKFGGGAVNKALTARHEQLKADLASAAELKAAAESKLALQETRLSSLEAEIAGMRRTLALEAEGEKARLIAAAEERAARIKTETTFLIEQQVRGAAERLRRESAEAALTIAEEILRRSIGAGDQQKLLDTFIGDVEARRGQVGGQSGGGPS